MRKIWIYLAWEYNITHRQNPACAGGNSLWNNKKKLSRVDLEPISTWLHHPYEQNRQKDDLWAVNMISLAHRGRVILNTLPLFWGCSPPSLPSQAPTTAKTSCSGPLVVSPRASIANRGCSSTQGLLIHTPCGWNITTRPSSSCQLGDHLSHARFEAQLRILQSCLGLHPSPQLGLSSRITSSERSSLLDHSTQSSSSSSHTCCNFFSTIVTFWEDLMYSFMFSSTLHHPTLTPAPREAPSTYTVLNKYLWNECGWPLSRVTLTSFVTLWTPNCF